MALEEIRHDLQERNQRWQAIEGYCGFPIRSNPGLAKLEMALYGDTGEFHWDHCSRILQIIYLKFCLKVTHGKCPKTLNIIPYFFGRNLFYSVISWNS